MVCVEVYNRFITQSLLDVQRESLSVRSFSMILIQMHFDWFRMKSRLAVRIQCLCLDLEFHVSLVSDELRFGKLSEFYLVL